MTKGQKKQHALFCLVVLVVLLSIVPKASADEFELTPTPVPSPISYKLPYPGLLPDNPLYFLKSFRDNVMGFFIGNPVDKAEFALLQADKKVAASYLLVTQERNKAALAESTFSEAQDYFEDAIEKTAEAKKQGMNVDDLTKRLAEANQKHFQVLHEIEHQVNTTNKKKFQDESDRAKALAKKVKSLQQKH